MSDHATHCDLTIVDGAPTLRLRSHDGLDVTYQLTPSEAASLTARLARTLANFHRPRHDRTDQSLASPHPGNDVLRQPIEDQPDPAPMEPR